MNDDLPGMIEVRWTDTTCIAKWTEVAELGEWAQEGGWECSTVGYTLYEDEDCVVVAARLALDAEPPQCGLIERIPKGVILSIRELVEGTRELVEENGAISSAKVQYRRKVPEPTPLEEIQAAYGGWPLQGVWGPLQDDPEEKYGYLEGEMW